MPLLTAVCLLGFCKTGTLTDAITSSRFSNFDSRVFQMLPIGETHMTSGAAQCAVRCLGTNKTCYSFSMDKTTGVCSIGSWLIPQNRTAQGPQPKILSTGMFCNSTENVTLDYSGDLNTCQKAACLGRIPQGNNTSFNNQQTYKSCRDVTGTNLPRRLVQLTNGLLVLCDTVTNGGGWTVFQRRVSGQVDFNRSWTEYKEGFGDYGVGEFYLGNDNINCISSRAPHELRIEFTYQGSSYFFTFSSFYISDESLKYRLKVSGYSGAYADANTYFNDANFSTYDQDNDDKVNGSCAVKFGSGWWFHDCYFNNLNGLYGGRNLSGIHWSSITGQHDSLSFTEMKMRPV